MAGKKEAEKTRATTKRSETLNGRHPGLNKLLGYHLRMAHVKVFQDFRQRLGSFEITPAHLGILLVVEQNSDISQTDLSQTMRMDRSALVGIIDKLEKKGWIKRGKTATDRRRNELRLTPKGEALLEKLWPSVEAHEAGIVEGLTEKEQETLFHLLSKVGQAPQ